MSNIWPKKKISIVDKKVRHGARKTINLKRLTNVTALGKCKNCQSIKLAHRVCPACGYYNNKQVMTIKTKSKGTIIDA